MKYALGNMLNGAGGLNADGLSLDLQFAADKTLTARKGPTPTFTRASGDNGGTTYFGPSGINVAFSFYGNDYDEAVFQNTVFNGRFRWTSGDISLGYTGTAWALSYDGNNVATSAPTSAFRPDEANWSGTAAVVTATGAFGIVKAANNEPRFDHDPVTLACKGLLIEESRTNLILQSEGFGTTWQAIQLNVTGTPAYINTAEAPTGLTTADKLIANTTTSTHQFRQDVTLVTASIYTVSCYFKAAENTTVSIAMVGSGTGGGDWSAFYNVSTGVKTGGIAGFSSSEITNAGNGWYRCSVTFTAVNSGTTSLRLGGANTLGNNLVYTGNNSDGVLLWGAQLETGSFATSYIPTTTGPLTRSADVCSITGSDFSGFYNPLEGSLFTSVIFNAPTLSATGQLVVDINDTTTTNRLRYFRNPTTGICGFANTSGSTTNVLLVGAVLQPFVMQKFSAGFKLDDYAFYVNNSQAGVDNLGALLVSPTTLNIGDASAGSTRQYTNGTISSLRYYKKRLSNVKLQALTV